MTEDPLEDESAILPAEAAAYLRQMERGRREDAEGTAEGDASASPASDAPTVVAGESAAPGEAKPTIERLGQYTRLVEIDRGGMGVVYKAYDPSLERTVCVKVISEEEAGGSEAIERFLREARLAARLHHPNILPVHEVGEADGRHFLAMDFVDGRTFADLLEETEAAKLEGRKDGYARLRDEVRILADVADAVAYAHTDGVIHRDLKPANVLLDHQDHPYVIDFGLAKEASIGEEGLKRLRKLTVSGQVMGTPEYMSPEQAAGRASDIGPASDVYTLGAILYEILTGHVPFADRELWEMLRAVITEDPEPPRRRNRHVPGELEAVCLRAMEKKRARRYASAADVAIELRRWLCGDPVEARQWTRPYRAWRWVLRRRRVLAPSLVALSVLLWLGAWGWRATMNARDEKAARTAADARAQQEQAAREAFAKTNYERIAQNVAHLEAMFMSQPVRRDTAEWFCEDQFDGLSHLIKDNPWFGPAWSWRGWIRESLLRVKFARLEDWPPDAVRDVQADYDTGCTRSPEYAIVWCLRGRYTLNRYAMSRGLPTLVFGGGSSNGVSPTCIQIERRMTETPEEAHWREQGLTDLQHGLDAAIQDRLVCPEDLLRVKAQLLIHLGGDEQWDAVVRMLCDAHSPEDEKFRGVALCLLRRFDESIDAFSSTLRVWPFDARAWMWRGMTHAYRGTSLIAQGADPRDCYQRALDDLGKAIELSDANDQFRIRRACVRMALGLYEADQGLDPRERFENAITDLMNAVAEHPVGSPPLCGDVQLPTNTVAEAYALLAITYTYLGASEAIWGRDPRKIFREAEQVCEIGMARNPSSGPMVLGLAQLYMAKGDYRKARMTLGTYRGTAHATEAKWKTAEAVFLEVFGVGPAGGRWGGPLLAGSVAMRNRNYALAHFNYNYGLLLLGEDLASLPPEARAKRTADARFRATLASVHYDLARILSRLSVGQGRPNARPEAVTAEDSVRNRDAAFEHLKKAADGGFDDETRMEADPDLAPLRDDPRWRSLGEQTK